ncbi:hypothetical protein AGOR_G00010340 [Albula goreensis]|uniref:UDP-glucuronosyltransferase n=1 Tax=Albula goreensis TaxID=1534307 RepID=A0A8T3E627_9TELE|nr:hypothetical protein AGOR_G00010340 [Albula goreensis]
MFYTGKVGAVFVLVLCLTQCTYSGKVLLWPGEYSHWLNMKSIVKALAEKGHELTVLISSASPTINTSHSSTCKFEIIPVPFTEKDMTDVGDEFLRYWMYESSNDSFIQASLRIKRTVDKMTELNKAFCRKVFHTKGLLEKLRKAQYDVLVTDPMFLCGKPTTFCEVMGKADIWLIRTYWDFEYPRPFLPNFKFVGGLHCEPAKPLSEDMEDFVQSSGDDGIVVFSLGSMIKNLTKERANTFASALGQIPQKVIWRYSGEKPETLAPNTRVYDWIPQNDLIGHPKTKAFITHGGTNGIYEAIYHGIPMVGIPLFADQPDNMSRIKAKGAAVVLHFNNMQSKDLVDGLNTVMNDPSYKENAVKLSRIHHDQPMKPLDRAVFWIEFVMRNKGAKHLRVQAHNLSWYQYHSLDVFAVLLVTVMLVTFISFKTCCFCLRKCCLRSRTKSKKE